MRSVIGACGYIGTGSSAVSDLLKEFDENQCLDKFEFKIAYQTDGLQDLKYHLNEGNMKYEGGLTALQRFEKLCKEYTGKQYNKVTNGEFDTIYKNFINELVECEWIGLGVDPAVSKFRTRISHILKKSNFYKRIREHEKKRGEAIEIYPLKKVTFSVFPDNFDEKAKEFTRRIFEAAGLNCEKNIVLDQPFAGNSPNLAFPFFDNPKAIVVDRDPRDYFLLFCEVYYSKGYRQFPIYSVDDFIHCYKKLRVSFPQINTDNILHIHFEDLVYDYERTVKTIADFCGISNHVDKFKYFKPEMSINNTQLFTRFPAYREQIGKIESELPEYLYDFSRYKIDQKSFHNDFFIDNPLNPSGRRWKGFK